MYVRARAYALPALRYGRIAHFQAFDLRVAKSYCILRFCVVRAFACAQHCYVCTPYICSYDYLVYFGTSEKVKISNHPVSRSVHWMS